LIWVFTTQTCESLPTSKKDLTVKPRKPKPKNQKPKTKNQRKNTIPKETVDSHSRYQNASLREENETRRE